TPVARQGSSFHPIGEVAAFAPHIKEAKRQLDKRRSAKRLRIASIIVLLLLLGGGSGGFFIWQRFEARQAKMEAKAETEQKALEAKRKAVSEVKEMGLVALVSFGEVKDVKIKSAPTKATNKRKGSKRPGRNSGSSAPPPDELAVKSCELSQGQIFGSLRRVLGKLNVCVEAEKSGPKGSFLPKSLELDFVVLPSGKVVDFAINDRHYRTGPLKNCMTKIFRSIKFPSSTGSNCPVTIPLKIG
ncbi:hypothetical protein KAI87_13785, partial [Myxococcota bacterium]|nr:hypothetical protein [Myxococcota bacterium]